MGVVDALERLTGQARRVVVVDVAHFRVRQVEGVEACLSVPQMAGEVERHERIVIRGYNRQGKAIKIKVKGWLARIFQHEIDHLDGILFTDRASRIWRPKESEAITDEV